MAETRSQRMQVVLVLAERNEQKAGQQLSAYRTQLEGEQEQLRQLEAYADQYIQEYSSRRTAIRAEEMIAYSSFIQRLGAAQNDQKIRIHQMQVTLNRLQQAWQIAYQKRESIKDLIVRLQNEENALLDKRLQKELDELVGQAYVRRKDNEL